MMPVPQTVMAVPRCSSGKISHMMACAIGITAPPPSPCRMRMATRNSRFGAMPERNELAVKVTVQIRKKRRRPNTEVSHPLAGITTALAARYEVMTHDISSMLAENEPCMWGRATLVMLVSSTCITVTSMTEKRDGPLARRPDGRVAHDISPRPRTGVSRSPEGRPSMVARSVAESAATAEPARSPHADALGESRPCDAGLTRKE